MNTDCNIELDYIDKKGVSYLHINIFTSSNCRKRTWTLPTLPTSMSFFWGLLLNAW